MDLAAFRQAFPHESDYIEFKQGTSRSPLHEAIVAFSNTDGGVILVGVDDLGRPVGRERGQARGIVEALHEAVSAVRDPGRYRIHAIDVAGNRITALSVAPRLEGFAQTPSGRVLVRRGARNVALFGADLARFIQQTALTRYESTPTDVALAAADAHLVSEIHQAFGWGDAPDIPALLASRGLIDLSGSEPLLTVAGCLYLLPEPHSVLGKTWVEVLRYPEGSSQYDRRVQLNGPAHRLVEQATSHVAEELGVEPVVLGTRRYDLPKIPRRVLREAIANAIAHRSYEATGTPVRIELRPDAVIVTSPGSLPEPVTVENIRDAQAARNMHVIDALRRFGLAEDVGQGVDVMQDLMNQELLDQPQFADTGHAVEVTLPARSVVSPQERAWLHEIELRGEAQPADRILLVHAARGDLLTNAKTRELLGCDSVQARVALRRLTDARLLTQHGQRGGTTYTLGPGLVPPLAVPLDLPALLDVVESLASEGPITNAGVRDVTGLDRAEALWILNQLVSAGRLERRGSRRGTTYVRPGA